MTHEPNGALAGAENTRWTPPDDTQPLAPALALDRAEITMELLDDIARALQPVARDYLPMAQQKIMLQTTPPAVVLQIPGPTNKPLEAALMELAQKCKAVFDKALPSLPLEYRVIGGSEAAGIEIRAKPNAAPIYPHIITAKLAWISFGEALRRQRPYLPERIVL